MLEQQEQRRQQKEMEQKQRAIAEQEKIREKHEEDALELARYGDPP